MRRTPAFLIAAALVIGAAPARAWGLPDGNAGLTSEHVREARYAERETQRYPTTWGDEAAQTLGVRDGKWEAFATKPSSRFEPSLNAGVDQGSAMLRLSWR